MATYHPFPLEFQRASGARQRYWIKSQTGTKPIRLGGLLFATDGGGKTAGSRRWIGWDLRDPQFLVIATAPLLWGQSSLRRMDIAIEAIGHAEFWRNPRAGLLWGPG